MPPPRLELGIRANLALAAYKTAVLPLNYRGKVSGSGETRTHDLLIKNQLLQPTELPIHKTLLVEKSNVTHRCRLKFGVHINAMPAIQIDRLMIRVSDLPACVNLRITLHYSPVEFSGCRVSAE